jgi:hypothetical protein
MASNAPLVPSHVEPDGLADLIADAQLIALPQPSAERAVVGLPRQNVVIPADSVSLVEGYADYGA